MRQRTQLHFLRFIWLLVLTACTTQHLPVVQQPYYPLAPDGMEPAELLSDAARLEQKRQQVGVVLTPAESLRLLQLQQVELKSLSLTSSRYQELKNASAELEAVSVDLRSTIEDLRAEVSKAVKKSRRQEKKPTAFEDSSIRSRYYEIARLWNQNENDLAFERSESAMKDEALKDKVSDEQWARFLNLSFRIALEREDWGSADRSYKELKKLDSCSETTAEAALLLSLHRFLETRHDEAYQLLQAQCDPDESVYGAARRDYWLARFIEKSDPAKARALLLPLIASKLPSYYSILAHQRLGAKMDLPARGREKTYLREPLTVPGRVHKLFTQSETWLADKLRRESQLALRRAALILEEDEDLESTRALLYTAHLHQASGSTLDAMRLYSKVTERLGKYPEFLAAIGYEFLDEMFPRPHAELVEAFTRYWGVDPDFAYAIIRQESAFNPSAVSPANARGWMQLMPFLAEQISSEWGFPQFYQPDFLFLAPENLKLASYHLYKLGKILPHPALIAGSYNAGVKRVSKWWKQYYQAPTDVFVELIPITETRNYVKLVMRNYYAYKLLKLAPGESLDPATVPPALPGVVSTL